MLKINKSILIICMISLFLIIGQISASDTDLIEINDSNTVPDTLGSELNSNGSSLDMNEAMIDEITDDSLTSNAKKEESYCDCAVENENPKERIAKKKDMNGIAMANDSYSCGPASLATALNRFGLNLSINEVSKHTNTSLEGTAMQSLIDAARYYNYSAYGVEIDARCLKENYIVHLNVNGCEHWSVIAKATDTHILLADSTAGIINLTIDEFNLYFTKKAIALSNSRSNDITNSIDLNESIASNHIKILNKRQCLTIYAKGLKRKVVGYRTVWKYGFIRKTGWVLRPKVVGGHVSFSQWQYVKGYYVVWGRYKAKEPIYKYYYVSDDALTSAKIKR